MGDDPSRAWTEAELADLVRRFDACAVPLAEWHHRQHLAVTTWYVLHRDEDALDRVRSGIRRLNARNGVVDTPTGGYHETVTRFFVDRVRRVLRGVERLGGETPSPAALAARVEAELGDKLVILRYYSRELVMSADARARWVEPDLRSLDAPVA